MLASQIMTPRPLTGSPTMTLGGAATVMRRGRFRHLPIVSDGRVVGVLSDRDVQRALAAGAPGHTPVGGSVRRPAITTTPDTPVEQVARLLQENKIGCVPVVSVDPATGAETLAGIVTESDVFAVLIQSMGIAEPGSRIVVDLSEPAADLLAASRAFHACGAPLLALHTEPAAPAPDGERALRGLRLIARVGTINPGQIVSALRRAGLHVVDPAP